MPDTERIREKHLSTIRVARPGNRPGGTGGRKNWRINMKFKDTYICLHAMRSAVKSGENWSEYMEEAYNKALKELGRSRTEEEYTVGAVVSFPVGVVIKTPHLPVDYRGVKDLKERLLNEADKVMESSPPKGLITSCNIGELEDE